MNLSRKWLADTAERTASTYVEALLGLLLASGIGVRGAVSMAVVTKAALAAIPAAFAVVKSALASRVGSPGTAALFGPTAPLAVSVAPAVEPIPIVGDPANVAGVEPGPAPLDAELARAIKHSAQTAPDPKDVPHG